MTDFLSQNSSDKTYLKRLVTLKMSLCLCAEQIIQLYNKQFGY